MLIKHKISNGSDHIYIDSDLLKELVAVSERGIECNNESNDLENFPLIGELNEILRESTYKSTMETPLRHNSVETLMNTTQRKI